MAVNLALYPPCFQRGRGRGGVCVMLSRVSEKVLFWGIMPSQLVCGGSASFYAFAIVFFQSIRPDTPQKQAVISDV
jgi:hypothetical protein